MGGSPSERKFSTKEDRTQRYIQNKKGRTSFFLYHRTGNTSLVSPTTTVQPLPVPSTAEGIHQLEIAGPPNMKTTSTTKTSSQSQVPMLLEMEVVSSSSDSEESDDNSSNSIFSTKAAVMRRRKRRSVVAASSLIEGAMVVVEPHVATKVQFSHVEVRSYTITIGDHPCCTIGCPITLDWEYTHQDTLTFQEYESQKYTNSCSNSVSSSTKMNDLRISPEERIELLLLSSKLSELEIRRASRKFHRNNNCSSRQCERIHDTFFHSKSKFPISDDEDDDDIADGAGAMHKHNVSPSSVATMMML